MLNAGDVLAGVIISQLCAACSICFTGRSHPTTTMVQASHIHASHSLERKVVIILSQLCPGCWRRWRRRRPKSCSRASSSRASCSPVATSACKTCCACRGALQLPLVPPVWHHACSLAATLARKTCCACRGALCLFVLPTFGIASACLWLHRPARPAARAAVRFKLLCCFMFGIAPACILLAYGYIGPQRLLSRPAMCVCVACSLCSLLIYDSLPSCLLAATSADSARCACHGACRRCCSHCLWSAVVLVGSGLAGGRFGVQGLRAQCTYLSTLWMRLLGLCVKAARPCKTVPRSLAVQAASLQVTKSPTCGLVRIIILNFLVLRPTLHAHGLYRCASDVPVNMVLVARTML